MTPNDLKIEAGFPKYPGGQQIGVPSPAIRVTHLPTGLQVLCESERSQAKNKAICLSMIEWGLAELGWRE